MPNVGKRISAWREYCGMSRQELADAVGVTVAAVYQWEASETVPVLANLEKVVEALGITMGKFYGPLPKGQRVA